MLRLDLVGTIGGTRFAAPAGQVELIAGGTAAQPSVTILNHGMRETVTRDLAAGGTGRETDLSVHGNGRIALAVDGVSGSVLADALDAARATGGASSVSTYLSGGVLAGPQAVELLAVPLGAATFLVAARPDGQGLGVWQMSASNALTPRATVNDTPALSAANISALTAVTLGGTTYVVAGSASEHGLQVWRMSSTGSLTAVDRQGPAEGVPIANVTALRSLSVGGESFVIAAAGGSSSLTAFRMGTDGRLRPTDQVMDDLNTRFDGVTALDTIAVNGRIFVVAAGADAGISLFTLCPMGRFVHLSSQADTAAMGLTAISAIEMVRVGSEVQVIVASGAEAGLTVLRLDLGGIGGVVPASAPNAAGGSSDDLVWRRDGTGTIEGGAGDDILIDGTGADSLRGGTGEDLFVLGLDGQRDVILDFDPRQDRIDLSQWAFLRSVDQITVASTANGAVLRFGNETLEIRTASGTSLTGDQVRALALLPVSRVFLDTGQSGNGRTVTGTDLGETLGGGAGDDALHGNGGNDTLFGGAGADSLWGGDGVDVASYADAAGPVMIDPGDPSRSTGEARGDTMAGIEAVEGSAGNDTILGGTASWVTSGLGGNDRIAAGAGLDTLYGGTGNDTLDGGDGANRLDGGLGADVVSGAGGADLIAGGDGNDSLDGGDGSDRLWGDAGDDLLDGGAGNDSLYGGTGDDRLRPGDGTSHLDGGAGFDWVSYAAADSGVLVNLWRGAGGAAAGNRHVGIEAVEGSASGDTLSGNAAANALAGAGGNDVLAGGDGFDTLEGGVGDDLLRGDKGNDALFGGEGNDRIGGGQGDDQAEGGAGNDRLFGGIGSDRLQGDDGDDLLLGGAAADVLDGGDGADILVGGDSADSLRGGAGTDRLEGGWGDDALWGGGGADVFLFRRFDRGETDVIHDFANGADRIELPTIPGGTAAARFAALDIADARIGGERGTAIEYRGHTVFLSGVSADLIDVGDFLWA